MDFEGARTPMGPKGPFSKVVYHDVTIYEDWIDFRFILVHKGALVITQSCIGDNEQSLWFKLID